MARRVLCDTVGYHFARDKRVQIFSELFESKFEAVWACLLLVRAHGLVSINSDYAESD